ncbi:MAG: helix-turn-helix domain-containing protein [Polyangiales bacterium]
MSDAVPTSSRRLRALVEVLRAHGDEAKPRTADSLAQELGVSVRTLYRDLDRLRSAGVGVETKAGVGVRFPEDAHVAADSGKLGIRADVRATARGLRALRHDAELALDPGRGDLRSVRASTRESLIAAVLRSGGDVVIVAPPKLRREVRSRARAIARAHKGKE